MPRVVDLDVDGACVKRYTLTSHSRRPWRIEPMPLIRIARAAIALALLINVVTAARLLPPVTPHDRLTITVMSTLALLEAVAFAVVSSRRGSARALVYVLGAFGLVVSCMHVWMFVAGVPDNPPPSVLIPTLVQMLALASAAGLSLVAHRRPTVAPAS